MNNVYEFFAQEPYCWHPAQIATLTDVQIEHLYLTPAKRRSDAMKAKAGGFDYSHLSDDAETPLPTRAEFVRGMVGAQGGTAAHWSEVYDKMQVRAGHE